MALADRRVGVAVDFSPCSKEALKWAVDNVVRDGDHLILINVQKEGQYEGVRPSYGRPQARVSVPGPSFPPKSSRSVSLPLPIATILEIIAAVPLLFSSPIPAFIPLSEFSDAATSKKYGIKHDPETLDLLNTLAKQKEVVIVVKTYWGDPREKILEAIDNIPLSCLIIGNRGLSKLKRVIMGSVSNHVVSNATCPVTVVKHAHEG